MPEILRSAFKSLLEVQLVVRLVYQDILCCQVTFSAATVRTEATTVSATAASLLFSDSIAPLSNNWRLFFSDWNYDFLIGLMQLNAVDQVINLQF